MNYTASHAYEQLEFDFSAPSYLLIPSALPGFHNTDTNSNFPHEKHELFP